MAYMYMKNQFPVCEKKLIWLKFLFFKQNYYLL